MPDLHLYLVDPTNEGPRARFTLGDIPVEASGIQALANRWAKVFMTAVGSHPLRRNEGTRVPLLVGGNIDHPGNLQVLIQEAIEATNQQVQGQDAVAPRRPSSERLRNAQLTEFVQLPDGAEFWVEISNILGESLPLLLPYAP